MAGTLWLSWSYTTYAIATTAYAAAVVADTCAGSKSTFNLHSTYSNVLLDKLQRAWET